MLRLAFVILHLIGRDPLHAPARPRTYHGVRIDGTHDAVCAWGGAGVLGDRARPEPTPCRPPLRCTNPCGIQGCTSVCRTLAEWRHESGRP